MHKINSFSTSTHNYFSATNIDEESKLFLASYDYYPRFSYREQYNKDKVSSRILHLENNSYAHKSLECVLSSINLQTNDKELDNFRRINAELYGIPDKKYLLWALFRLTQCGLDKEPKYYQEVLDILGVKDLKELDLAPSQEVFNRYKNYFDQYRKNWHQDKKNVRYGIIHELDVSGLSKQGWVCQELEGQSHCVTNHKNKTIKIGRGYAPRTIKSAERIAVHEVYGHALRGMQISVGESEGFAIMLEQLLDDKFNLRRSYRYVAAALGWGILGKPMNFRNVYDILWRIMVISGKYQKSDAQKHAFKECYRVFRGGRPDVPGAVYLKDAVYFISNVKMWEQLGNNTIGYDDFIDIIEGRRTILT